MDRRKCLMNAEHDHGQPHACQHEADCRAAAFDCRSRGSADCRCDHPAYGLEHKNSRHARDKHGEQRCQEQVEHLGNPPMQPFFDENSQGRDQDHGDDPAAPRKQIAAIQHNILQSGMRDECSQCTSQDRRSAEHPGGLIAHKEVHAPEDGIPHDSQKIPHGSLCQGRIDFCRYGKNSGQQTAGDKGRNQRQENTGDLLEHAIDGRIVPCPYLLMKLLPIPDSRLLILCIRHNLLERIGNFIDTGRSENDLELIFHAVDPQYAIHLLDVCQLCRSHIMQRQPQPCHAV